jgi:hypothetical protein
MTIDREHHQHRLVDRPLRASGGRSATIRPRRMLHLVEVGAASERRPPGLWERTVGVACDAGASSCAAAMLMREDIEHCCLVFCDRDGERRARAMGLNADDRIVPVNVGLPATSPETRGFRERLSAWMVHPSARAVREFVRARGPFDVVQAWNHGIAELSRWAAEGAPTLPPPTLDEIGDDGLYARNHDAPLEECREGAGLSESLGTRTAWRAAMGLSEDDFVLIVGGDPPDRWEAVHASRAMGLLDSAEVHVRVLCAAGMRLDATGRRHARHLGLLDRLHFTSAPLPAMVAAGDALFLLQPSIHADHSVTNRGERAFATAWMTASALDAGIPVYAAEGGLVGPFVREPGVCIARVPTEHDVANALIGELEAATRKPPRLHAGGGWRCRARLLAPVMRRWAEVVKAS